MKTFCAHTVIILGMTFSIAIDCLGEIPPLTFEQIVSDPASWPKEVTITEEVNVTLMIDGQERGKMKIPAGSKRALKSVTPESVILEVVGSEASIPPEKTNLVDAANESIQRAAAIDRARRELAENAANLQASTESNPVDTSSRATPAPESTPEESLIQKEIGDHLAALKSGKLAPVEKSKLNGVKYYAIYFSAHWCPPCRKFTPDLVSFYKRTKRQHPEFELIFVSRDKSEEKMVDYMKEYYMGFPALNYETGKGHNALGKYASGGIPNLVFIDAEGNVLSSSYVDGAYVGPRKVLDDIAKTLR
ncbi:thioredoxin-like domain-containing protein [Oscillatoria amoena NRMC-F 0135]|nr:thioredoxin-like domain-containing protein [Oscillatoria laete-virens]MDL5046523.1 thioredoxin-like domain-containing protein [Oscillatoria amoena NRMC-F 0135]MDL5054862.1 thioredoxin-like domain-containing protein [Oscillatoria laete-virens NRMC-F 0139]